MKKNWKVLYIVVQNRGNWRKGQTRGVLIRFWVWEGSSNNWIAYKKPVMIVYVVFDWRLIGVIAEAVALPAFPVPQCTFSTTFHPHYLTYVCVKCKVYTHTHFNRKGKSFHHNPAVEACVPASKRSPWASRHTHTQVQFLYCLLFLCFFPSIRKLLTPPSPPGLNVWSNER